MNRKDLCSVYGGEGNLKDRHGLYRIIVLAANKQDAAKFLGTTDYIISFYHISKHTHEWQLYDEATSVGDVFAAKYGTMGYFPVDPEDVNA